MPFISVASMLRQDIHWTTWRLLGATYNSWAWGTKHGECSTCDDCKTSESDWLCNLHNYYFMERHTCGAWQEMPRPAICLASQNRCEYIPILIKVYNYDIKFVTITIILEIYPSYLSGLSIFIPWLYYPSLIQHSHPVKSVNTYALFVMKCMENIQFSSAYLSYLNFWRAEANNRDIRWFELGYRD